MTSARSVLRSNLRLRAFIAGVPLRAASRRISITAARIAGSLCAKSARPWSAKVLTMELQSARYNSNVDATRCRSFELNGSRGTMAARCQRNSAFFRLGYQT